MSKKDELQNDTVELSQDAVQNNENSKSHSDKKPGIFHNSENKEVEKLKHKLEQTHSLLEEKDAKIAEWEDSYRRKVADFDNYKKRILDEREKMRVMASKEIIMRIIPVISNFDRALKMSDISKNYDAMIEGVRMVSSQIHSVFEEYDVKPIESVGKEFDPNLHEAVMMEEREDIETDNLVLEEFEKGYTLGEMVVLHSKVKIGKKKAKAE